MANSPSRKEYIEAAKAAFLNLAKKSALKNLGIKFGAFWVTGPMGALTAIIVSEVLEAGIEKGEVGIYFIYVDFRVNGQEKDFVEAALKYYRIKQSGTEAEKHEAEEILIKTFDDFVKLNRI